MVVIEVVFAFEKEHKIEYKFNKNDRRFYFVESPTQQFFQPKNNKVGKRLRFFQVTN